MQIAKNLKVCRGDKYKYFEKLSMEIYKGNPDREMWVKDMVKTQQCDYQWATVGVNPSYSTLLASLSDFQKLAEQVVLNNKSCFDPILVAKIQTSRP